MEGSMNDLETDAVEMKQKPKASAAIGTLCASLRRQTLPDAGCCRASPFRLKA